MPQCVFSWRNKKNGYLDKTLFCQKSIALAFSTHTQKIFSYFFTKNKVWVLIRSALAQHVFSWRNKKNIIWITLLSGVTFIWSCSTVLHTKPTIPQVFSIVQFSSCLPQVFSPSLFSLCTSGDPYHACMIQQSQDVLQEEKVYFFPLKQSLLMKSLFYRTFT